MHNFRELKIWSGSMEFAVKVYNLTTKIPSDEKFGLTSQIRRCAISIPSNIAEGAGRSTNKQFQYFLEIAIASINELQTQTELAFRLGFIKEDDFELIKEESTRIQKMIWVFYRTLSVSSSQS
jgi:four helix bundle protein